MAKSKTKTNDTTANLGFEAKLWAAADALRNNMDAAEYKHVVLGLIFLKYISDAFEAKHAELDAERAQGADPEDSDEYRAVSIFWVPMEARWSHLKADAPQYTTWRLAKMNLAIRGIDAQIGHGDTFHNDRHPDLKADYVLANPPFNDSDWRGELLKNDKRWVYGVPPADIAKIAGTYPAWRGDPASPSTSTGEGRDGGESKGYKDIPGFFKAATLDDIRKHGHPNGSSPMPYDPARHHRRSIRLPGYDYTQAGAYFVTLVTHQRECLFGDVVDGAMQLNAWGEVALTCWRDIPRHFTSVRLDAAVVMPNHVHGVLWIEDELDDGDVMVVGAHVGAQHAAPLPSHAPHASPHPGVAPGSLAAVVRSYKSAITKYINAARGAAGDSIWQRNYYEHIIRDETSLNRIRCYIDENPLQWAFDDENPRKATS